MKKQSRNNLGYKFRHWCRGLTPQDFNNFKMFCIDFIVGILLFLALVILPATVH